MSFYLKILNIERAVVTILPLKKIDSYIFSIRACFLCVNIIKKLINFFIDQLIHVLMLFDMDKLFFMDSIYP